MCKHAGMPATHVQHVDGEGDDYAVDKIWSTPAIDEDDSDVEVSDAAVAPTNKLAPCNDQFVCNLSVMSLSVI